MQDIFRSIIIILFFILFTSCNQSSDSKFNIAVGEYPDYEYKSNYSTANSLLMGSQKYYIRTSMNSQYVYFYGRMGDENWLFFWLDSDVSNNTNYLRYINETTREFSSHILVPRVETPDSYVYELKVGKDLGSKLQSRMFTVEYVLEKNYKIYYTYVVGYNILENIYGDPVQKLKNIFYAADGTNIIINNIRISNLADWPVYPVDGDDYARHDALKAYYYDKIGGRQPSNLQPYIELIGIIGLQEDNQPFDLSLGATCQFQHSTGNAVCSFVFDINFALYNNEDMENMRIVASAHELGHARDYQGWGLTYGNHNYGHNGKYNNPCIMSAGDRTYWGTDNTGFNWNNNEVLWQKQRENMSFCEGHAQRLYTIHWPNHSY